MILTRNSDMCGKIEFWEDSARLIKIDGIFFDIDPETGMCEHPVASLTTNEFKILFPNTPLPRKGSKRVIERLDIVEHSAA